MENEIQEEKEHLPIYGVGPFYGIGIVVATIIGIVLSVTGVIDGGKVTRTIGIVIMIVLGLAFVVGGFLIWKVAAVGKNSIDGYIEKNILCTTGVFGLLQNGKPLYTMASKKKQIRRWDN